MGSPGFFFAEAFRSFRNNFSVAFAAIATVAITTFLLGAFIAVALVVQDAVNDQQDKIDVRFFLSDSATDEQRNDLQDSLTALQAEGLIDDADDAIEFVSKEDARKRLEERVGSEVFDQLASNPLPASFDVKPASSEQSEEVIARVGDHPALSELVDVGFSKDINDRLNTAATIIRWFGLGLVVALLIGAVLLISNTIRLSIFARRRDIEVMRLVGGTNWFIRWPFVIEGVLVGLIGAVLAVILLVGVKELAVDPFTSNQTEGLLNDDGGSGVSLPAIAALLIIAGAVIGAVGSGLSLRRFLKV